MEFAMSPRWAVIRVWFLLMILIVSLAGTPAFAQGGAAVRVDPATQTVQVNDVSTVAIRIDNVANLTAFEIHLSFNPAVLEVTGITNGGFIAADFVAQNTFDNAAGTLDYAVAQMNRAPAQGSGTLLNVSFRARASGSSTVTTRDTPAAPGGLLLSDQNGMAIQASWTPGTITVGTTMTSTSTSTTNPPTATPTPTGTSTISPGTSTFTPTGTSTVTPATATPTATGTQTTTPGTATSTPTYTPTATPPLPGRVHIVRWGEWVYCIARAYRVSPTAIIKQNHLWWPYILFPNQRLTIPDVPWTNMTAGPVCQAQFPTNTPTPSPTPTPTSTSATPGTNTPPTATASP